MMDKCPISFHQFITDPDPGKSGPRRNEKLHFCSSYLLKGSSEAIKSLRQQALSISGMSAETCENVLYLVTYLLWLLASLLSDIGKSQRPASARLSSRRIDERRQLLRHNYMHKTS
ncbi:unnamed protein product [Protopolystoma xenopodis]|uniref:Uncharacterized protein n=1 Tax=Protopolystoma xenopodis TaxID=117903 RepID=A0A3S5CBD6_9PLAT|nr:unnamed protein product [Protopolystoma xenopodis]